MNVLFLTIGDRTVASSRVRVYGYLPYLQKQGIKALVMPYTPSWQCKSILSMQRQGFLQKAISKLYSTIIILSLLLLAPGFDIIYLQKVLLSKFTITLLRALNSNIIFDFDDAIFINKETIHLLKNAASVVVANNYLREFAVKHTDQVYQLISPVEVNSHPALRKDGLITLGWIGSPETSKYLYPLIRVFKDLKERFSNLNIEFIGAGRNKEFESLAVKMTDWSMEREKEYLQSFDIGIMPLTDDDFSRGKAGYKLLQYMVAGIPCVASPVGINRSIIKDGVNGFLASSPEQWLDKISLLINNASLRQQLGEQGQRLAEKMYSYRVTTSGLIKILTQTTSAG